MSDNHVLYRFRDSDGVLLYVGITKNPPARFAQHERDKFWWSQIADISLQHFPSRLALLEAERIAIENERPLYNVQHNSVVSPLLARYHDRNYMSHGYSFVDRRGNTRTGDLQLVYEVNLEPIGDDFDARRHSAKRAFAAWRKEVLQQKRYGALCRYPERVIPIAWYVDGAGAFECASPTNYWWFLDRCEWFGDFYSQPIDLQTNRPISDLRSVPIEQKTWKPKRQSRGGFITMATGGWKPFPLQRWVDLDYLTSRVAEAAS